MQNQTQYLHQLEVDQAAAAAKEDMELDISDNDEVVSANTDQSKAASVDGEMESRQQQRVNASFDNNEPIAVLVIACNREFVSRSIDALLR